HTRSKRDPGGRGKEIQRLIGRALRAAVDLGKLGERTITVDCDVLNADGGTRVTSITGAWIAIGLALRTLVARGELADTSALAPRRCSAASWRRWPRTPTPLPATPRRRRARSRPRPAGRRSPTTAGSRSTPSVARRAS